MKLEFVQVCCAKKPHRVGVDCAKGSGVAEGTAVLLAYTEWYSETPRGHCYNPYASYTMQCFSKPFAK